MARRSVRGSRVVLTGASSGIGRALAVELARQAAKMVIVARRGALLKQLATGVTQRGGKALVVVGDITQPAVQHEVVERAEAAFGGLDILINNAGVSAHGPFETASAERLRQIMDVNFIAAAELIRISLPLLKRGTSPIVVNMGSILGHRGIPLNSEYCASKFALRGWSEAIRPELARDGIDLLLVSPGTTDTEFFEHLIAESEKLPWGQQQGVPAEAVAAQIVRAIQRRRHEITPNWRGRLLVLLNRFSPRLVDRVMNRYG
jgi:short-subunit dehydrogenase